MTTAPNYTKIHGKVETLVKESIKTSMSLEDQKIRSIVWWNYSIAAIFCEMFNRVIARIKLIFKDNIRYVSGDTVNDL